MSSIEIRSATTEDAAAIAHVHYEALSPFHEFYAAFFAIHPRDSMPDATISALSNPSQIFLVGMDTSSGEVVGFIRYHLVHEDKEEEKSVSTVPPLFAPKKHMEELWARVCDREDEMEVCYINASKGKKHACKTHIPYSILGVLNSLLSRCQPSYGPSKPSTKGNWKEVTRHGRSQE